MAILESGCHHPSDCEARFVDEQLVEVALESVEGCRALSRVPAFPPHTETTDGGTATAAASAFWLGIVPCVTALLVSLALASAYENATILPVLVELGLPPLIALLLYQASPKATIAPLLSLAVAALGLNAFGVTSMSAKPLDGLLLVTASIAGPILFDLELMDLGRLLRWDVVDRRLVPVTFVVMTAILLAVEFPAASRIARREDADVIRRLVGRITAKGNSLVLERLDQRLARDAERRVLIVAAGRTYDLSRASNETVVDQRNIETRIERHGATKSYQMKRDQKQRVTLVLPLRGGPTPDEVEIDGVRGFTTTYSERVALAK
jgi:hypothetical protein